MVLHISSHRINGDNKGLIAKDLTLFCLYDKIITATASADVATVVVIDNEPIRKEPDNAEVNEPDDVNVDELDNGDVDEADDGEVEEVDADDVEEVDNVEIDLDLALGPPGVQNQDGAQAQADQAQAQNPGPQQPKVCKECGTTNTPLWRRGPMGLKTLCNACGLRYWKDERILSTKLTLRR